MVTPNKRVLVISSIPSHPQNAGNRTRIHKMLKNFQKKGCKIDFLYSEIMPNNKQVGKKADLDSMKKEWDKFFYFNPWNSYKKALNSYYSFLGKAGNFLKKRFNGIYKNLKKLFPSRDFNHLMHCVGEGPDSSFPHEMENYIRKILRNRTYDIVIAEYIFMSKALEFFDNSVLKVLDTHDVYSRKEMASIRTKEKEITPESERKAFNRTDIILAIQDKEKEMIHEIAGKKKKIITLGHKIDIKKQNHVLKKPIKIFFVGVRNERNIPGINFFAEKVFPELKKELGEVKLIVAGEVCKSIESPECIKLGETKHLEKFYSEADLVIAPLLKGTGLKIKVVEALGYGKPVVGTDLATEGLESLSKINNSPLLVANNKEEFVKQIKKIFTDGKYSKRSKKALDFVNKYNSEVDKKINYLLKYNEEKGSTLSKNQRKNGKTNSSKDRRKN